MVGKGLNMYGSQLEPPAPGTTYSEVLKGEVQPERRLRGLKVDVDQVLEAGPDPEQDEGHRNGEELVSEDVHCLPELLFSVGLGE